MSARIFAIENAGKVVKDNYFGFVGRVVGFKETPCPINGLDIIDAVIIEHTKMPVIFSESELKCIQKSGASWPISSSSHKYKYWVCCDAKDGFSAMIKDVQIIG